MERVEPLALTPSFASARAWLHERLWIVGWWLGGRAVVLATALVVDAFGPRGYLKHDEGAHLFGLLGAWDGRWYRLVAANGYLLVPGRQSDPAFFPFFPLLLRGAHALGFGYWSAGLMISNLALLAGLVGFHALTCELFGEALARRATAYLAIFPLGYVFSMAYPESAVLALVAFAALAALRQHWKTAALCLGAVALARPEGLFLALPILAIAWKCRTPLTPVERGLALGAVLAPVAALASFVIYLSRIVHDPFAWTQAERAWGRHFSPLGFGTASAHVPAAFAHSPWVVRDLVALGLYLGLLVIAHRAGAPWPWLVAGIAILVVPVFSGTFDSVGRFGLLVPPVFWGLAALGHRRRADVALRAVSLALLVAATATIPLVFP